MTAWALAHLHMQGLLPPTKSATFMALMTRILSIAMDIKIGSLANAMWALAALRLHLDAHDVVAEPAAALARRVAAADLGSFSAEELAHVAWALVALGASDQQLLLKALAKELASRLQAGAALGRGDLEAASWAFAAAAGKDTAEAPSFDFAFS